MYSAKVNDDDGVFTSLSTLFKSYRDEEEHSNR